jgi:hypothetical protein
LPTASCEVERAALALARGSVERDSDAAHQRGEESVVGDQKQDQRAALLRRREVDALRVERRSDLGRDAAEQQPLRSPLSVVRTQQRFGRVDRGTRSIARTVVDQPDGRRPAGGDVAFEFRIDRKHDVEIAISDPRLVVGRRWHDGHLLPLEKCNQRRRVACAIHR